jgi:hypothetical protein
MKRSQLHELVKEVILENEIEAALKQTFNQIGKELKSQKDNVVVDKDDKVDEAVLSLAAGIALSGPTILKIIANVTKIASKALGGKGAKSDAVIAAADKAHHFLIGIVEKILGLFLPSGIDPKKKHKLAEGLFYLIIGGLLGHGAIEMVGYSKAGNIAMAALKGALNAVKSGEIIVYLKNFIA